MLRGPLARLQRALTQNDFNLTNEQLDQLEKFAHRADDLHSQLAVAEAKVPALRMDGESLLRQCERVRGLLDRALEADERAAGVDPCCVELFVAASALSGSI